MATIKVYRPDVVARVPATIPRAERRPVPDGAVLTLISNGKPRARELLERIASQLRARLPIDEVDVFSKPSAAKAIDADEARMFAARSHLVVSGLGDWAACTACSLHDAVLLEERGVPAAVVLTEPFQGLAASFAATLGMPGYPPVIVPHPIAPRSDAELDRIAVAAAEAVATRLAP